MSTVLFETPRLADIDLLACQRIEEARRELDHAPVREWTHHLWVPRLWRLMLHNAAGQPAARVNAQDIYARPLQAAADAQAADAGYRRAMTLALRLADDPDFVYSVEAILLLHHTMSDHDLDKQPGRLRRTSMAIRHEDTGAARYVAPDATELPSLMRALVADLNDQERASTLPGVVRAALAKFTLVSIHPFADGNGRISRCLQALVLARAGFRSSEFCSLDHYFGTCVQLYCDVLGSCQSPSWDVTLWIRFCLRGHLWQIAFLRHKITLISQLHNALTDASAREGLSPAAMPLLLDAAAGLPVQALDASSHRDLSRLVASRHLADAVRAGLLVKRGKGLGEIYAPSPALAQLVEEATSSAMEFDDPFKGSETERTLQALEQSDSGFWKL